MKCICGKLYCEDSNSIESNSVLKEPLHPEPILKAKLNHCFSFTHCTKRDICIIVLPLKQMLTGMIQYREKSWGGTQREYILGNVL